MMKCFANVGFLALTIMLTSLAHSKGAQPFAPGEAPAAKAPDAASQQALRETQEALTDPSKRAKMIEGDSKAQSFDARIKGQLGDQTEGAYQISSQIMEKLAAETGGDTLKLQELVGRLMANPKLLENYMTAADREKIREMAEKLEAQKGHAPVSPGR